MSTISASTTSTTAFKVTSDTTGTLVFQTGASPTTAMSISSSQIISFTNPPTATGAGSVATNTAYGTSALNANTTGADNTAYGWAALLVNTTGGSNTAIGQQSLQANLGGASNTGVGRVSLYANTSGSYNVGVGEGTLRFNTTASYNTAVGYQAGYNNTTGTQNVFQGSFAGYNNTTGSYNTSLGYNAYAVSGTSATGNYNTAIGNGALNQNTTASNNTAVGYQAGYTNSTGAENVYVGYKAGLVSTGSGNCLIGRSAGEGLTTGSDNTFVGCRGTGSGAGHAVTTGSKNTIIGQYGGNQGGLDIRTASNKIVLSDGDGNPLAWCGGNGAYSLSATNGWVFGNGGTSATYDGVISLNGAAVSGYGPTLIGYANAVAKWYAGSNSFIKGGTTYDTYTVMAGNTNGVNLTNGATSWASASDARLKNVTGTYTNALADIAQIEAVKFTWKSDEEAKPQVGVIAQSVQNVVPEAVETIRVSKEDETDYLSVRYTELIPLLVASIQQLKAEFDAYKEAHP